MTSFSVFHLVRYLEKTKKLCALCKIKRPDRLWLDNNSLQLSQLKMRHWFSDVIRRGDTNVKEKLVKFHSVRGIAASSLGQHFSIERIVKAMNWSSSSTFLKYYSKLGVKTDETVVVAGEKLN